jgi:hypothetical protein
MQDRDVMRSNFLVSYYANTPLGFPMAEQEICSVGFNPIVEFKSFNLLSDLAMRLAASSGTVRKMQEFRLVRSLANCKPSCVDVPIALPVEDRDEDGMLDAICRCYECCRSRQSLSGCSTGTPRKSLSLASRQ